MSAKPAGGGLESARKLFSIYARTVQYFGECFLYNSNIIHFLSFCAQMTIGDAEFFFF